MRKSLLFIFCWLGWIGGGFAQRDLPPIYKIQSDSAFFELDTAHFQVLADLEDDFTFERVQQSPLFRFEPHYRDSRQSHVYWMRMRVKNSLPHTLSLYLCDFNNDYVDMYWLDSSRRWQYQRTGELIPKSQLPAYDGTRERNRLLFRLLPGQETIIYQRSANAFWHPPIKYLSPVFQTEEGRIKAVFKSINTQSGWKNYWFEGITIGILVLAVCYNLLTFFATREQVYLYFGICLLFFVLDRNQYRVQLAFFDEQPYGFRLLGNFFFITFFVFFVQSIRRFVQPDITLSSLNRAISISLVLTVFAYSAQYLSFRYPIVPVRDVAALVELLIRIVYSLCIILAYRMLKRGAPDARFVLIAIIPLFAWWLYTLVGNLLGSYFKSSLFQQPGFFEYVESICLAWMIVFFSGALVNRYNLTRRQVMHQAIEKEQLDKQREIERNRIIADQNERLEQQVKERTTELQQSLETLKATQNQLVQKEKLASLGELTAGIAHEIQNPLNFVNNFAEVSVELLGELHEERQKAQHDEVVEGEILDDLQQNLQKIHHHGHRASAIVKGMLEHSRASTGEKLPTDLSALADEYLRLAYHGLRAKNKNFTCQLITDFDSKLLSIAVTTQDMGRVLLNLYNNAFYAVQEEASKRIKNGTPYQPTITVQTCREGHKAIIRISDNGGGIPEALKHKIFQPFFTTKPTGQGTGLGLSLSYDIITKRHRGELNVESREGNTDFTISLPIEG